jgi:hypothetical protein
VLVRVDHEQLAELAEKIAETFAFYRDPPNGKLPDSIMAEIMMPELERLLGAVRLVLGVGCPRCGGVGRKSYGSTATWRGGIGGQAITEGVCDGCWGTGRTDCTGVDLRRLASLQREVEMLRVRVAQKPLSAEEQAARKPPPPETLVGALQDKIHQDKGRAKQARVPKNKKISIKEQKRRDAIGLLVRLLGEGNDIGIVVDAYYDVAGSLRLRVQDLAQTPWPSDPLRSEVDVLSP